ncbi:MAG TPA: hypothetical protein VK923_16935 [Euzebyales bacterium]|nr:hypothetical protein [Euzebyales bacterium]
MNGAIVVYIVYVALAITLISWLGVLLHRDGRIFLDDVFRSQPELAAAVSRLLVTGFLVFTLGYALLLLRINAGATPIDALRSSIQQFGLLLLSLGAMHSLNMLILLQVRRRAVNRRAAASRSSGSDRRLRVLGR